MVLVAVTPMQECLYAPGISKGRKTDDCQTKTSMKNKLLVLEVHARIKLNWQIQNKRG